MERVQLVGAAYRTVETFAALTRRPLRLREGATPQLSGNSIQVPFRHPSFYCLLEHELAHVVFRSNAELKARVDEEARHLATAAGLAHEAVALGRVAAKLYNLLEDERVNSLWGELYPGSLAELQSLARRVMSRHRKRAHADVVTYALCVSARLSAIPAGPFDFLRPSLERCLALVQLGAPQSALLLTRELVHQLLEWRTAGTLQWPTGEELDASESTVAHRRLEDLSTSGKPHAGQAAETRCAVDAAAGIPPGHGEALHAALALSREEAKAQLETLREELQRTRRCTRDDWMARSGHHPLVIEDVDASALPPPRPLPLEDAATVSHLSRLLRRARGRRTHLLSDGGLEVDVEAAVQRRLSRSADAVFRAEVTGRGFRALLLVDRSNSMQGERTAQVEHAARVLRRALSQPGISLETWCFRSRRHTALVQRLPPDADLQTCAALPVEGQTPLHLALAAAANRLRQSADTGHLFVLTDGRPCFIPGQLRARSVSLQDVVREETLRARRHGVGVSCLVVGDELADEEVLHMFGPRRHWVRAAEEETAGALVRLVTSSVLQALHAA